jgi:predicted ATP-binding protein involved in virulence
MKIRKLQLKNIGVFDDETINFQECPTKDKAEIHILTGENGSGKTTILQALASIFNRYLNKVSFEESPITGLKWGNDINTFSKKFRQNEENQPSYPYSFVECHTLLLNATNSPDYTTVVFADTQSGELNTSHDDRFIKNLLDDNKSIIDIFQYSNAVQNYSNEKLQSAVFAFSGYRQIEYERVQANYLPKNFNPLSQSLEFVKDYRKKGEITINQLVANNISNRALSKEDGSLEESKRYETVINSIETFIKDVTDYEVKFVLKRSPNELKIRMHGEELDFDVLPDGLRSLISWIADLLGRVDLLKWQDDLPITEKNLILFLDEIEVHLHPAWQRKVLPIVQKLFKNAQIFVSTHSPFVVNSVDDAWVYKLKLDDNGKATIEEPVESENSNSITQVLREVFGIEQWFGLEVQNTFEDFKKLKHKLISNGTDKVTEEEFLEKARSLADEPNDQLKQMVRKELEELSEIKKKAYKL